MKLVVVWVHTVCIVFILWSHLAVASDTTNNVTKMEVSTIF